MSRFPKTFDVRFYQRSHACLSAVDPLFLKPNIIVSKMISSHLLLEFILKGEVCFYNPFSTLKFMQTKKEKFLLVEYRAAQME